MVDRAEDALFRGGDLRIQPLYQFFHVFAFSGVICGAGVFHHGQAQAVDRAYYVAFLDVDERAYERDAALVHIRGGGEAGESSLVEQGHQGGLRHVVRVVPESEFAAAETYDLAVQRASAEFCAERAGVGFLPCFEDDLGDVRFQDMALNAYLAAVQRKGVVFGDGGVLKAHVHGDGGELEALGGEASVRRESGEKEHAVLSARKPDEYAIAVRDHLVVLYSPSHGGEYLLHTVIITLSYPVWQGRGRAVS